MGGYRRPHRRRTAVYRGIDESVLEGGLLREEVDRYVLDGALGAALGAARGRLTGSFLRDENLKGFVGFAKQRGYTVGDEETFLREQQARVFAWAQAKAAA
jgi:hypothetical protein